MAEADLAHQEGLWGASKCPRIIRQICRVKSPHPHSIFSRKSFLFWTQSGKFEKCFCSYLRFFSFVFSSGLASCNLELQALWKGVFVFFHTSELNPGPLDYKRWTLPLCCATVEFNHCHDDHITGTLTKIIFRFVVLVSRTGNLILTM